MLRKFQYFVGDQMVGEDDNFFAVDTNLKALAEEQARQGTDEPVSVVTIVGGRQTSSQRYSREAQNSEDE